MSLYINDQEWVIIEEIQGELQAQLLRGLLESQGIPVKLNQEGAGRAFGLTVWTPGCCPNLGANSFREER
jgi:hypothetical protein